MRVKLGLCRSFEIKPKTIGKSVNHVLRLICKGVKIMEKLKLSPVAEGVVRRLINSKDSDKVGCIAAVDPQTGEIFYGKNEVEAAKEGRRAKNDPKAVFFFVRVGYPSVHVLKSINLQGYIWLRLMPPPKSSFAGLQIRSDR